VLHYTFPPLHYPGFIWPTTSRLWFRATHSEGWDIWHSGRHVCLITSPFSLEFCLYSFWLLNCKFIQPGFLFFWFFLTAIFFMCMYHLSCYSVLHLSPFPFIPFTYGRVIWISLFVVGGAFFPVIGEHIWYDPSHSTGTDT
jgi:hypothetical protein